MMNLYVAAPYETAPTVREIHAQLHDLEINPVSMWVIDADGGEKFDELGPLSLRATAEANDEDLRAADAVLVVDADGKGRETYAEMRVALEWKKPVVFVGKPSLSTWRKGVLRARDVNHALMLLGWMRTNYVAGKRGFDLVRGVAA